MTGNNGSKALDKDHELPTSDRATLEAILNEISARLVIPSDKNITSSKIQVHDRADYVQIMIFRLGEKAFGFDILTINEVMRSPRVTRIPGLPRSEEHTSELQSPLNLVCSLL